MSYPSLGIDLETTGFDPYTNQILSVQIANGEDNVVDILDVRRDNFQDFFNVLRLFKGRVFMHNSKFDLKFLRRNFGILYFDLFDTKLADKAIDGGRHDKRKYFALDDLAERYLDLILDKGIRNEFTLPLFYGMDFTEGQLRYGALDAWVLPRIAELQARRIKEDGLEHIAQLEFDVVPAVVRAELSGILLDVNAWTDIYWDEHHKATGLKSELVEMSGRSDFNPGSHAQVKEVMKAKGILVPVIGGKETTKEEFIDKLDHPFIRALLEFRTAEKRVTTYGKDFLNNINAITGRVHSDFDQYGADTGRFSSDTPNTQNIPKRDDAGKYRDCFIAADGHLMISADFSGQEIMVMAERSRDPALIQIYLDGKERHTATAALVFGVPYEEVTKDQRRVAKTVNFGVGYGSSAWNMANKINKPVDFMEKVLEEYWRTYPVLQRWQRRAGLQAWIRGYSETMWGRRRYFDRDFLRKDQVMRQGANMEIQGTAADMTKRAIVLIDRWIEESRTPATFVNFVHDEVEIEVQEAWAEDTFIQVKQLMERAGTEFVTVVKQEAEAQMGRCWM